MVPTYLRRRPGSPSNGFLGSALILEGWRNDAMTTPTSADSKALLRQQGLARRGKVDPAVRDALTARLAAEGVRFAETCRARTVSAFHPIRDEPDTLALLDALAQAGFATALPVTVSRGSPLTFRLWRPGDPTVRGAMNIAEPSPVAPAVEPDLLFVPLAAFDRRGHRIGFGAGHYDRTLSRLRAKGPIQAVGVAYAASEVDAVPNEPHDQPVDFILTENELIDARGVR
jgi:5-formyltetrahydrofolate cyclo-ligase